MNKYVTSLIEDLKALSTAMSSTLTNILAAIIASAAPAAPTRTDMSGSAVADGDFPFYVELGADSRWSLQFLPVSGAAEVMTVTVEQSNDDPAVAIAARTYSPVTVLFFGEDGFIGPSDWIEPELPTRATSLKVNVNVAAFTVSADWTLWALTGGNS